MAYPNTPEHALIPTPTSPLSPLSIHFRAIGWAEGLLLGNISRGNAPPTYPNRTNSPTRLWSEHKAEQGVLEGSKCGG